MWKLIQPTWRTNVSRHGLENNFYRRLYSPILLSICKNMQKYNYIIPTQLKLLMCAKLTLESCLLAPKAVQNTTTVQGMRCFLPIFKNASIQISSPRQLKHVNSLKQLIVQPYRNHKSHVSKSSWYITSCDTLVADMHYVAITKLMLSTVTCIEVSKAGRRMHLFWN